MDCIFKKIYSYAAEKPIRFHMPGHKGKDILRMNEVFQLDVTELDGFDNLHEPNGIIKESEKKMAETFGADYSFFIINGSSAAVIAAILTVSNENDIVVCGRNSHQSLYKALFLSGAKAEYVMPQIIGKYGICGDITPAAIKKAVDKIQKPAAVFITSPTYEGVTSNIEEIASIAHNAGCALIVDEAHGAHFKFDSRFPKTALEQGADIVIQSHHKTLAVMGQGAVLHVKGTKTDIEKLTHNLSVLQTTSPSYLIMASLDKNRSFLESTGAAVFTRYVNNLISVREDLKTISSIDLFEYKNADIGKVLLYARNSGDLLYNFLRSQNIYGEMYTKNYALLMTSYADTHQEYDALLRAVSKFEPLYSDSKIENISVNNNLPTAACTAKRAYELKSCKVDINSAEGRICKRAISQYPPGIPLIVPGEIFSQEIINFIKEAPNITGVINEKNTVGKVKQYVLVAEKSAYLL